jgi:hypothetical protein
MITLSARLYGLRMNPRSASRGQNHETRRSEAEPLWASVSDMPLRCASKIARSTEVDALAGQADDQPSSASTEDQRSCHELTTLTSLALIRPGLTAAPRPATARHPTPVSEA